MHRIHSNKKGRILLCLLFTMLLSTAHHFTAYAAADQNDEEEPLLAPYFIVQGSGDEDPADSFPLKSTDVITNINGVIAETYVTQTYANEGDVPINARYVFPTASDVTVHGMKMEIGNQVITAKIKEKEEAKEEFETAKSAGKSASLLEQKRPNVFTMDVANIMPGDTVHIELHYTQLITPTEGIYEFVFPTVVGPRYAAPSAADHNNPDNSDDNDSNHNVQNDSSSQSNATNHQNENGSSSNDSSTDGSSSSGNASNDWIAIPYLPDGAVPLGDYHITVNLCTGVPIADLSCKTHEVSVSMDGESKARITLSNPEDYAGNRDFILKYKLTGDSIQSGLVLTGGESENYFMLTVQPPEHYTPDEIPPREYIFVLDVSGSMNGYPLDTAKELINDLAKDLKETDRFNLILFANETTLLSEESLTATSQNIQTALKLVDEQMGGGGTSLLPALNDAIALPKADESARSIVIITDGYISNEQEIFELIEENMDTASFFPFGIGHSVNDYLIKGIAATGLGEAFIVTDSEDADDCAERFRTYIEAPLLTDITVNFDGFDVYDAEPSTPSILYAQKPIVLFGKWRGTPSGTITVSGKSGSQSYVQEIPVTDVTVDTENEALRYLWARTRLDRIAGFGSIRNDSSTKEEITRLGLEYNMTTPYTSFIAVVDTIRNAEGESTDVNQALPLPLHVTNLAVGGGYTAYSEPGDMMFLLLLPCLALTGVIRIIKASRKTSLSGNKRQQPE